MDKMNPTGEMEAALRDVARQRDWRLGNMPTLSVARRTALNDVVAREFPLEAALREAGIKRDRLLQERLGIPASVERILCRQLAGTSGRPTIAPGWLRLFRSPMRLGLTACALITAAILCFAPGGGSSLHNGENSPRLRPGGPSDEAGLILDRSPIEPAELFARTASIRSFNLNTNEPASLQVSLFANTSVFLPDGKDVALGLRLDLPVRAFLTGDGPARTP